MKTTFVALALMASLVGFTAAQDRSTFTMIVMDPLAAPLSCPCVKGYAQRDYKQLATFLEKHLQRPVEVHFSESLENALTKKSNGKADLVIGKESVVRHQSAKTVNLQPVASLTGKDGKTTMTGLFVVASADKALSIEDLKGYRVIFGPDDSDEKNTAAISLMKDLQVQIPVKREICTSCSDGATTVIDLHKSGIPAATVISSYAQPLLEGCGTIKKGDLRVVGETDPVPFVVAFLNAKVSGPERDTIQKALLQVGGVADLCNALETKAGFVAFQNGKKK